MKTKFHNVLDDISAQLESHAIQHCLIGGLAASLRGRMRNTEDVGLIILTDVENALNFFQALPHDRFRLLFPEFERVARTSFILATEQISTGIIAKRRHDFLKRLSILIWWKK